MRISSLLVLGMVAQILGVSQTARADNTRIMTVKYTTATSYTVSGRACQGGKVRIVNATSPGVNISATIKESDASTVIVTATNLAPGGSVQGTITQLGKPLVCQSSSSLRDETCDPLPDVQAECPIPTLSEWAAFAMVLLLLSAGTVVFGRRRLSATVQTM